MTTDSASGDLIDEHSPHPEYGEISPVDYRDSQERYESSESDRYPSAPAEATYDTSYLPGPPRASSYQPADSSPYHPYGRSDRRAQYMSSHERVPPDTGMGSSTPGSTGTPYYPSFAPSASNPQPASYFPNQTGSGGQWHLSNRSSREDLGRLPVQSWSQSGQEPYLHHVDDRHRQYQLSQTSPPSWVDAGSSEPLASNNSPAHSSNYFPTLNTPFYPPQNSSHNLYATQRSPSPTSDTTHQYGAVSHVQGSSATSRQEAAYHSHHYSPASAMQAGYTHSSGSTMQQYHSHHRGVVLSTQQPPAQSMQAYPHQQPMNTTPPAGSATDNPPQLQ